MWTLPSSFGTTKYKFLQKELFRFTDWTKYWILIINPTKCSVIRLEQKDDNNNKCECTVDDQNLGYVPNYKPLSL